MAKGINKIVYSKYGLSIESCYDDYLWIGIKGDYRVMVIDTDQRLAKLRDEIDRIISKRNMKRRKRRRNGHFSSQESRPSTSSGDK